MKNRKRRAKWELERVSVKIPEEWEAALIRLERIMLLDVSALVRATAAAVAQSLPDSRRVSLAAPSAGKAEATLSVALLAGTLGEAEARIEQYSKPDFLRFTVSCLFHATRGSRLVFPVSCSIDRQRKSLEPSDFRFSTYSPPVVTIKGGFTRFTGPIRPALAEKP